MSTDVPRVKRSATVLETVEAMNRADSTGIAVVDKDDHVVGIIMALRVRSPTWRENSAREG